MSASCAWEHTPTAAGRQVLARRMASGNDGHEMDRALVNRFAKGVARFFALSEGSLSGESLLVFVLESDTWIKCGNWNSCLRRVDSGHLEPKHPRFFFLRKIFWCQAPRELTSEPR